MPEYNKKEQMLARRGHCLKQYTCTSIQVGAEVANRLLGTLFREGCEHSLKLGRVLGGSAIPYACLLQKAWCWCWKMGFQYLTFSQLPDSVCFSYLGTCLLPMDPLSEPKCPTTLVMKVFRSATRKGHGPLSDNHVKS